MNKHRVIHPIRRINKHRHPGQLFFTMALFIVGMVLVFCFATQLVIGDLLRVMVEAPRREAIEAISSQIHEPEHITLPAEASILFLTRDKQVIHHTGTASQPSSGSASAARSDNTARRLRFFTTTTPSSC